MVIDLRRPEARERLAAALGVARWANEVSAYSPYPSVYALVAAAERAAAALTDAELDEALSHHPRIGDRPRGNGSNERLSSREQAGLGSPQEELDAAIARGNEAYEQRFGRVFLVRAAGRDRRQILDELHRRMTNGPAVEAEEAKNELRQIMALRLVAMFGEEDQ